MALTVKGQPITPSQMKVAAVALVEARNQNAGSLASVALIYAGMGESSLGDDAGTINNVWQANNPGAYGPSPNWGTMARAFLLGKGDFCNGGAMSLARRSRSIVAIANAVENNGVYEKSGGNSSTFVENTADSYGHEWAGGTAEGIAEARAIVAVYGGGTIKGGVAGGSSGQSGTLTDGSSSTTYAFSISGTQNPDEDYWTGTNRLAQEVGWYLFSSGEYMYYLDGQEMVAQQPAAHINRIRDAGRFFQSQGNLVWDNTGYAWVSSHKRRFRAQRRTKVSIATSPTEVTMQLFCGIDEIEGGDVVELSGFGPGDGRWIVAEARRSAYQTYSELTLQPPLAPITEAAAAGTTGSSSKTASTAAALAQITGGSNSTPQLTGDLRNKVVQAALAAIARQSSSHAYQYGQVRPYPSSLFGAAPVVTDCSGFSILCYKAAGAPDPNATSFDGSGSTYTLIRQGTPVATPQPGDLIFYAVAADTQPPPNHVAVYLGNGEIANMGGAGEPVRETMNIAPVYDIRSYL